MDSLTQSITELNGSVGALMVELRKAEARIRHLEQLNGTPEVPREAPLRGPTTEEELREVGRLPDAVRDLEVFEGDPVQYVYWIHSVEGILDDYKIVRSKPIYKAILKTIRGKIRGKANAALVSHNIFDSDWPVMKACLSLHYADKRDIRTLEHQLGQLNQGSSRLDEFYARVNHQFSLIINKLKSGDHSPEVVDALMETYRNRALDVFVRGLKGDLSRMIIVQKPRTLPEAYTACLDIQNLNFRALPIHGVNTRNEVTVPMNEMSTAGYPRRTNFGPNGKFDQGWRNNSEQSRNYRAYNRFQNQEASGSNTNLSTAQNAVVKMEVDRSMQSKKYNYANPAQGNNPFKRGPPSSSGNFPRRQKLFHINTVPGDSPREHCTHGEEQAIDSQEVVNYPDEQLTHSQQPANGPQEQGNYKEDTYHEEQSNFMEDGPPAFFI